VDGAGDGRDAFDAGLPPSVPGGAEARVAFVGTLDGVADYRGQDSRAYDLQGVTEGRLALSIAGRPAGAAYRLTWPTVEDVPAEWALTVTDGDTGETVDLRTADHLDFTASPTDWTSRFTVRVAPRAVAGEGAPAVARLGAARPNPATSGARFALTVDRAQRVRADLFDALGRQVAQVFDGAVEDERDLVLDTRGLAPGVYVLRVLGDTFAESREVTVVR
ncbi:MAG TPA: T9SS type A sorting domain-containing protein, partial [Rubricoccaceae bacterium]